MNMGGTGISFRGQGKKVKAMTTGGERHSPGASGLEVLYDDSSNTFSTFQPSNTRITFTLTTRHGGRGRRAKRGVTCTDDGGAPTVPLRGIIGLELVGHG